MYLCFLFWSVFFLTIYSTSASYKVLVFMLYYLIGFLFVLLCRDSLRVPLRFFYLSTHLPSVFDQNLFLRLLSPHSLCMLYVPRVTVSFWSICVSSAFPFIKCLFQKMSSFSLSAPAEWIILFMENQVGFFWFSQLACLVQRLCSSPSNIVVKWLWSCFFGEHRNWERQSIHLDLSAQRNMSSYLSMLLSLLLNCGQWKKSDESCLIGVNFLNFICKRQF